MNLRDLMSMAAVDDAAATTTAAMTSNKTASANALTPVRMICRQLLYSI
jgi:hypothetical protein